MGVLDVLPSCLSSVYFFWDCDYAALAPGKFSALKEVEWVQDAARKCPALHYYYMGFYIHSCHKMQYKADYHPSDLLCPERLCWVPFDRVKAALDVCLRSQTLSCTPPASCMPLCMVLLSPWACMKCVLTMDSVMPSCTVFCVTMRNAVHNLQHPHLAIKSWM